MCARDDEDAVTVSNDDVAGHNQDTAADYRAIDGFSLVSARADAAAGVFDVKRDFFCGDFVEVACGGIGYDSDASVLSPDHYVERADWADIVAYRVIDDDGGAVSDDVNEGFCGGGFVMFALVLVEGFGVHLRGQGPVDGDVSDGQGDADKAVFVMGSVFPGRVDIRRHHADISQAGFVHSVDDIGDAKVLEEL